MGNLADNLLPRDIGGQLVEARVLTGTLALAASATGLPGVPVRNLRNARLMIACTVPAGVDAVLNLYARFSPGAADATYPVVDSSFAESPILTHTFVAGASYSGILDISAAIQPLAFMRLYYTLTGQAMTNCEIEVIGERGIS